MQTIFSGQQEGERVLYKVEAHQLHHWVRVGRVLVLAVAIVGLFAVLSSVYEGLIVLGLILGVAFGLLGWWGVGAMEAKTSSYVTDRRIIRFSATTPWTVNSRSLSWDEVVKIKTKSQGPMWRLLGAGTVVAHARSTVIPATGQKSEQIVTNDDIELDYVIYYQDLGNYLDKLLYLFKNDKPGLAEIRAFVPKPKGKRY